MLKEFEEGPTQRHLVLTGEYGQGKSTAMLKFCHDWADEFLSNGAPGRKVPLLIELRGRDPLGSDPEEFLGSWGSRYGMDGRALYNLIRSGEAILIFEGFDELRNAEREYDRHYHFEALWQFAYHGTRLIFTGRPNFFLDSVESNRTLRSSPDAIPVGLAHTVHYELQMLTQSGGRNELSDACRDYIEPVRLGILAAAAANPVFHDICSRPSLLPVVASIWDEIGDAKNEHLSGAILIERYLAAVFDRKAAELERDRSQRRTPSTASYLLLPVAVRELLTLAVACRMCAVDGRNTITNQQLTVLVRELDPMLSTIANDAQTSPGVRQQLSRVLQETANDSIGERIEKLVTEIRASGLLVPDPASGAQSLRFPHKQFFEYLVAKSVLVETDHPSTVLASIIYRSSVGLSARVRIMRESGAMPFCRELLEDEVPFYKRYYLQCSVLLIECMSFYYNQRRMRRSASVDSPRKKKSDRLYQKDFDAAKGMEQKNSGYEDAIRPDGVVPHPFSYGFTRVYLTVCMLYSIFIIASFYMTRVFEGDSSGIFVFPVIFVLTCISFIAFWVAVGLYSNRKRSPLRFLFNYASASSSSWSKDEMLLRISSIGGICQFVWAIACGDLSKLSGARSVARTPRSALRPINDFVRES